VHVPAEQPVDCRSTGLPGKLFFWADFEIENFVKNILTLVKIPQKYVLSFYLITKLVIKISRHISNISIHFCVLPILSKIKLVFLSN